MPNSSPNPQSAAVAGRAGVWPILATALAGLALLVSVIVYADVRSRNAALQSELERTTSQVDSLRSLFNELEDPFAPAGIDQLRQPSAPTPSTP